MSSYSISHFIRQSPWAKATNERAVVEDLQSIHCPHGHSEDIVASYQEHPDGSTLPADAKRFVQQLRIGAIVAIPQSKSTAGDPILIIRIESDTYAGVVKGLGVICSERSCGHEHIRSSCNLCENSIEQVILRKDLSDREKDELMMNRGKKRHIEPFIALSRKITVLGQVLAPPKGDLERPWFEYWKKQQSIFQPKSSPVHIPYADITKTPAQKRKDGDDLVDFLSA